MNKLMTTAAMVAAISIPGLASVCSDPVEIPECRVWDVTMSLNTLAPKKTKCVVEECGPCGTKETEEVYYMTDTTRKLKGYIWMCEYACEDEPSYNCVIWDEKNKCPVIAYYGTDDVQRVSASDVFSYDKKADKATMTFEFAGVDFSGEEAIRVVATGLNGKIERPKGKDCYVKSISGHATGLIRYIKPSYTVGGENATCNFCTGPDPLETYEDIAKLLPLCAACGFESWCFAEDAPDMVPCSGTWKIKYNKKVSTGTKSISQLIPSYAR
jgi:hypothetical protein